MTSFKDTYNNYSWDEIQNAIYSKTAKDVELSLSKNKRTLLDFMTLISPAAGIYLEEMAQMSHEITKKRFGKTVQLFIPLYLSNECQNICTYCGFSLDNNIRRKTLNKAQILKEVEAIKAMGYNHVLLVTGEANQKVGMGYFKKAISLIKPYFSNIAMEVQPLLTEEYKELKQLGINTILVYQETYSKATYKDYHPKGKKSNFHFRLETPDRIGKAGIYKLGLGCLLGLEDWRTDSLFTAAHLDYLEKTYWQTKYSLSFPRIRPAEQSIAPKSVVTDRDLIQLICAYRLFNEEVELSMSTRESIEFRDNAIKLGITSISAGSKTNPGGYTKPDEELKQFEICDERSATEISEMIKSKGYEPVWKDWDSILQ